MAKSFSGRTENAGSAILGAPFWQPGVKVTGTFTRSWVSANGTCYEFMAPPNQPKVSASLDEKNRVVEKGSAGSQVKELDKFSVGALKGFEMALQDLAVQGVVPTFRDLVEIECTGTQKNDGGKDDTILFAIKITR
jgi:hypothetical protein